MGGKGRRVAGGESEGGNYNACIWVERKEMARGRGAIEDYSIDYSGSRKKNRTGNISNTGKMTSVKGRVREGGEGRILPKTACASGFFYWGCI